MSRTSEDEERRMVGWRRRRERVRVQEEPDGGVAAREDVEEEARQLSKPEEC